MDIYDKASEIEQMHRDAALAALKPMTTGSSFSHCEDCGEPIPEPRRKAVPGCTRCIDCQERAES